jgi:hypothetical protein
MLKWLLNPKHYHINKYLNNGNENFVRSLEYIWYKCKLTGKHYQYNLLDINYYKTGNISINGEYTRTLNIYDITHIWVCVEFIWNYFLNPQMSLHKSVKFGL